jgi:hypothetical protein
MKHVTVILFWVTNITHLMPEDGQYDGPKHVACNDETNKQFVVVGGMRLSVFNCFVPHTCRCLSTYQYHLLIEEPRSTDTYANLISDSKFASPWHRADWDVNTAVSEEQTTTVFNLKLIMTDCLVSCGQLIALVASATDRHDAVFKAGDAYWYRSAVQRQNGFRGLT